MVAMILDDDCRCYYCLGCVCRLVLLNAVFRVRLLVHASPEARRLEQRGGKTRERSRERVKQKTTSETQERRRAVLSLQCSGKCRLYERRC